MGPTCLLQHESYVWVPVEELSRHRQIADLWVQTAPALRLSRLDTCGALASAIQIICASARGGLVGVIHRDVHTTTSSSYRFPYFLILLYYSYIRIYIYIIYYYKPHTVANKLAKSQDPRRGVVHLAISFLIFRSF